MPGRSGVRVASRLGASRNSGAVLELATTVKPAFSTSSCRRLNTPDARMASVGSAGAKNRMGNGPDGISSL